jgi:hypothetical protein
MTAKELAQAAKCQNGNRIFYDFGEVTFEVFCDQLCREQRELCNEAIRQRDEWGYSLIIPNIGDKIFDFVDIVKMPEL